MKKIFALFGVISICGLLLFIAGCKKDDTTPPKLTLAGDTVMTIYLNSPFNDPGVTAEDNKDGALSVTSNVSSTNPNVNKTGTYYISYSVSDNAGNKSSFRRTVIVRNKAETLSGTYSVTDTCITSTDTINTGFTDGIIPSTTVNNRITFTGFGRYTNANNVKLSADIDFISSTVTIVPATIFCGTIPVNRSFSGGGALSFNRDTLVISSVEITPTDTTNCTYTYVRQ